MAIRRPANRKDVLDAVRHHAIDAWRMFSPILRRFEDDAAPPLPASLAE